MSESRVFRVCPTAGKPCDCPENTCRLVPGEIKAITSAVRSESKTPRTDECICSFAPGGWDVGRLVMVSRTIETELSAALQRAEKAEAELSRYREADQVLPEEPETWFSPYPIWTNMRSSVGVVKKSDYDKLRAHAVAVTAERDALREWEQMVAVALGVPGCNAAEMLNVIDGLREDAERYRYLHASDEGIEFRDGDGIWRADCPSGSELDSAIDSARKETP